jgi:chaperonin cofactor prefoldin
LTSTHALGAERLIDSAKVNGEALVDLAREQGRAILEQSNEARKTVLNDLAVKRKALHMQIDQLRAARDTLGTFVATLREQVDSVLDGINNSDEAARSAALDALRQRPTTPDPTEEELLAGTPLRHVAAPELEPTPDVTILPPLPDASADQACQGAQVRSGSPSPRQRASRCCSRTILRAPTSSTRSSPDFARPHWKSAARRPRRPRRRLRSPSPRRRPASSSSAATGALDEPLAILTRKVKRALQDDQNIMLERLRDVKAMITTELEDEHAQRARYSEAAFDALAECRRRWCAVCL